MQLSEEHIILRDMVRSFTEKEISPIADKLDREDYLPDDIFPKLGELGVLGVTVQEEYGGSGSDVLSQVLIIEELAKGSGGVALSYGAHSNLCAHNINKNGNEKQKQRYLPPLCTGEQIGALALTEPGAGSDAVGIQTGAVRDGDFYRLTGQKMFITNAPIADTLIVYAKTDKSMGAHGITIAGLSLGIAEAAFKESLKYSRERQQFGKPICEFQLIQAKLADMFTSIEAARLLTYDTALRTETEKRLRKESAAAVLFAAEMATKVCLEAIQIHGGYGYTLDFPVNRYLRDAKLMEIGAGTSEIRRLLIARELLDS
jgi:isovaleryl-CoA dehydrogenase